MSKAQLKRVMKRAGKLRGEGKSAKQAMKAAWKAEKSGKSSTTAKPNKRKKVLGLF